MSFKVATFVALLAIGVSARPQQPTFSHEGVGYAVLNDTLESVPDYCNVNSVEDIKMALAYCGSIIVGSFFVRAASQPLGFNLQYGVSLTFTGHLHFQKSLYSDYLIAISGENIKVRGSNTHSFHGHGEMYWDGKGSAGTINKPTFLNIGVLRGEVTGLYIKNCPETCVTINSRSAIVSGFLIDNRQGAPGNAAKGKEAVDTDGFYLGYSRNLTLMNHVIYNQGDCVYMMEGAHIVVDNVNCDGSHGFKIATGKFSSYSPHIVNGVEFKNSKLFNSKNALQILTYNDGGTGKVLNINYQNISFSGTSDYGITIRQDLNNQQVSTGNPSGNVPIVNVKFSSITGTMNGKNSSALTISCASGACTDILIGDGIDIQGAGAKNECTGYTVPGWC